MSERPEIDRWMISLLNTLVKEVTECLDDYEPTKAARAIEVFVNDNLSNWYVRLNRKRFWAGEMSSDKLSAYQTLHRCLATVAQLMAPVAPFFADRLYGDLCATEENGYSSVHLSRFPEYDPALSEPELEKQMALAQVATSAIQALRRKVNLKVRQPLQTLLVPAADADQKRALLVVKDLIASEVNVKEVKIVDNEESGLVKRVKADFKKLGPRYGKVMKDLAKAIGAMSQQDIAALEREGSFKFAQVSGEPVITLEDVEVLPEDVPGWLVGNEGNVTVALDVTVTPELRREGMARELINRIQNIRKSADYEITDKVAVVLSDVPDIREAVESFGEYIATQVLASSIELGADAPEGAVEMDIEGIPGAWASVKREA